MNLRLNFALYLGFFKAKQVLIKLTYYMKKSSEWSIMTKRHHLKSFQKKTTPLLFIILIFSHWPWKFSKFAIIWSQPLLMTYLQGLATVTIFAQKLILLFKVYIQLVMVKLLDSITVTLSGTWYRTTKEILKLLNIFKSEIQKYKLINFPLQQI